MTRQRELPFGLRFGTPRANWLPIEVRLGDHSEALRASGVVDEDPVRALVRLALLAGSSVDGEATSYWWTEPEGYWLSASFSGSTARLELAFTTSMHPGMARAAHRVAEGAIASCELDRRALATTIRRAVRATEAVLRSAHDSGDWTHELPDRDIAALTRILVDRGALRGA